MSCLYCQGEMKESTTTRLYDRGVYVLRVHNVPCQECSLCGEAVFETDTVFRLEEIKNAVTSLISALVDVNYNDVAS